MGSYEGEEEEGLTEESEWGTWVNKQSKKSRERGEPCRSGKIVVVWIYCLKI